MVYEDGTRDCPVCLTMQSSNPNRVRGPLNTLCLPHERAAHAEAMAGFAMLAPYMRRQLAFTDFLIEAQRRGDYNSGN